MDAVINFFEENASPLLEIFDFIMDLFKLLSVFFSDLITFITWAAEYVTSFSATEFTIAAVPVICLVIILATIIIKVLLYVIP